MSAVTGRVAEITAPRTFTVREQRFDPPGPGQVLIRVQRVGICASDLDDWRAGPADGGPPLRAGHEPVGIVPSFADYVLADPLDVVAVPDGVDPATALGEPLGCVVEGYRRAVPPVGARAAVIGLGFMGLVMTRLIASAPVAAVWAVDPRADARAAATGCGATRVFHPGDPELRPASAELVVEASGTQAGLDLATALAAEQGTLSILGFHQGAGRDVDVAAWNWKALEVVNAHVRDRRLLADATRAGLRLLAAGRLSLAPLLSHVRPLERIDEAYAALEAKPEGFHKAVVTL